MPAPLSDPLGRRGCSRSASSTDCEYTSVCLACEKPRPASVSNASRRHSGIVRASITKPDGIQPWDYPQFPPAILHCAAPVSPLECRWYTPAPITPRRTCGRRRIDRLDIADARISAALRRGASSPTCLRSRLLPRHHLVVGGRSQCLDCGGRVVIVRCAACGSGAGCRTSAQSYGRALDGSGRGAQDPAGLGTVSL
jgi:hypothetical protein